MLCLAVIFHSLPCIAMLCYGWRCLDWLYYGSIFAGVFGYDWLCLVIYILPRYALPYVAIIDYAFLFVQACCSCSPCHVSPSFAMLCPVFQRVTAHYVLKGHATNCYAILWLSFCCSLTFGLVAFFAPSCYYLRSERPCCTLPRYAMARFLLLVFALLHVALYCQSAL